MRHVEKEFERMIHSIFDTVSGDLFVWKTKAQIQIPFSLPLLGGVFISCLTEQFDQASKEEALIAFIWYPFFCHPDGKTFRFCCEKGFLSYPEGFRVIDLPGG